VGLALGKSGDRVRSVIDHPPPTITLLKGGVAMDFYYSDAYIASEYAFDTTRKSAKIAESLTRDPIPGVKLVEPTLDDFDKLVGMAHSPKYVNAVKTGKPRGLAESN